MAKMRGIKPETFTDDKILQVEPLARWLFVGIWTQACDNGHIEDNLVQLKVRLLPMDNCDMADLVNQLVTAELLERHDGYLKVPNLGRHQKIDRRYLVFCKWCECDPVLTFTLEDRIARSRGSNALARRAPDERPPGAHRVPVDEGEGEGELKELPKGSSKKPQATRLPDDWEPTPRVRDDLTQKHPTVDIYYEYQKFCDYWRAESGAKARKHDWDATFRNWVRRADEQKRGRPQQFLTAAEKRAQQSMAHIQAMSDYQPTNPFEQGALKQLDTPRNRQLSGPDQPA